ncbi:MAG: hypothetical protein EX263_10855 [Flavobacteriaceae bacterium]|nr:MAG: hypothetical protein EX263_10855 [Flavobacteriaceae bacterium]
MKAKLILILILLGSLASFSQTKLADKFFENYRYLKAIDLYEKAYERGDNSLHLLTRLGDAYYNNGVSEKAVVWYERAIDQYKKIDSEYLYKYIQSLISIGQYDKANKWLEEYSAMQQGDSRFKGYDPENIATFDLLAGNEKDKVFIVENAPFNSKYSDFGAFMLEDKLYFASSRPNGNTKLYSWNKQPFLDLFTIEVNRSEDSISYGEMKELDPKINSAYHDANVTITKDGKTMYFTRDNLTKRNKLDYDRKGTSHLMIYKSQKIDGQWSKPIALPFNDDSFSTGHPALSPDDKQLFFVSDRPGGLGKTDIYVVDINDDGSYSTPRNLGKAINTNRREMFPFIGSDNTIYYSSDGQLNLGLLDIYKSDVLKDSTATAVNMGRPFNSGYDDFAFFIDEDNKQGYFSSNRSRGKGSDDIYSFNIYDCQERIEGVVMDNRTKQLIPQANVQLIDKVGKVIQQTTTAIDGSYTFEVDCKQTYNVIGSKEDYKDDRQQVITSNEYKKVNQLDLFLEPLIVDNQIVINPIFFDFNKWNIRTDAEYELENIVDVLKKHPTMVIKIEAHTDSRGSDRYNLKLSDRRAKATRDYIISRGIDSSRIESAIGYGETQLLNQCANRVKCSEEEHQVNRRSYFYILNE